jgi:telomerase protein component 1
VTQEQKSLEICLEEIERCRPFFIGLLGERYGWVPPHYEVPDDPAYGWLRDLEPGHSITALEIYQGVLHNPAMANHAFFYFRDPSFLTQAPEDKTGDFLSDTPEAADNLKHLKEEIRRHWPSVKNYACTYAGLDEQGKVVIGGLETFGQLVLEDLWAAIDQEHPADSAAPDELETERQYHEAFIEGRSRFFIGRQSLLKRLADYVKGDETVPLVVYGTPGCGKSALLANFARQLYSSHPDHFVLPHFIGVSPGSSDLRQTLQRLCRELTKRFNLTQEIPDEYEALRQTWPEILKEAAKQARLVVIIDALDQLEESHRAHTLDWLSFTLPPGMRLIISTLEGDLLTTLLRFQPRPLELPIAPLAPQESREIIQQILWQYRKKLEERPDYNEMDLLLKKTQACYPLYLMVACEELRIYGERRLAEPIGLLSPDIPGLFDQVLKRLEKDHGEDLVSRACMFLACSRYGLLETEMLELLGKGEQFPRAIWARLYRSLKFYLRPPGESGEGLLNFFHRQLAEAVYRRYLAGLEGAEVDKVTHQYMAVYFRWKADPQNDGSWDSHYPRGFSEMPYHLTHGEMWPELEAVLTDLSFVEAKCAVQLTYELIDDYQRLGVSMFPPGPPLRTVWAWQSQHGICCPFCLAWNAVDPDMLGQDFLCPQCLGKIKLNPFTLEAPWRPSNPIWSFSGEHGKRPEHLSPAVSEFAEFISRQAHILRGNPYLGFQLAANEPDASAPAQTAKQRQESGQESRPWLRWLNKPKRASLCLLTIQEASDKCVFSPNGTEIYSIGIDSVIIFDSFSGAKLKHLSPPPQSSYHFNSAPDYFLLLCRHNPSTSQLDIEDSLTGEILATCQVSFETILDCFISSHLMLIAVVTAGKKLELWDLQHKSKLPLCLSHQSETKFGKFSPDGSFFICGSEDSDIKLLKVSTGQELAILREHKDKITDCNFSPDGRVVATASDDHSVKIWGAQTGELLGTLTGHTAGVISCVFSPDGRKIASASHDGTIRLWDLSYNLEILSLIGHSDLLGNFVHYAKFSPDGSKLLSVGGMDDTEMKIWAISLWPDMAAQAAIHLGEVRSLAFSADGLEIASASQDNTVKIWDPQSGLERKTLRGHHSSVNCCGFSPNGAQLVSASDDKAVILWDTLKGAELAILLGHEEAVTSCTFSPDGQNILSASSDKTLRLWDARTGKHQRTLKGHKTGINCCAFSPDGTLIASGGGQPSEDECGEVMLWDVTTGSLSGVLGFSTDSIFSCHFSPNGTKLLTGSFDGMFDLYEIPSGRIIGHTKITHFKDMGDCVLRPDDLIIASVGRDLTLKLWKSELESPDRIFKISINARTHKLDVFVEKGGQLIPWSYALEPLLYTYPTEVVYQTLAWDISGRFLAAGGEDGRLYLFELVNIPLAPPFVTAWKTPLSFWGKWRGSPETMPAAGCPFCRRWFEIPRAALGNKISCPRCHQSIRINPFTIKADWRPVAEAWQERQREQGSSIKIEYEL